MRLLLDTCVWSGAKAHLEAVGHDVVWTGDWPQDPGDEEILARAQAEERVLVTLDKDFGEMAVHRGLKHHGVLRLVGFRLSKPFYPSFVFSPSGTRSGSKGADFGKAVLKRRHLSTSAGIDGAPVIRRFVAG